MCSGVQHTMRDVVGVGAADAHQKGFYKWGGRLRKPPSLHLCPAAHQQVLISSGINHPPQNKQGRQDWMEHTATHFN